MTEESRGVDKAGRRKKRMLTPSQKYEIWLQLLRQEVSQNEAAEQWHVDRSTIMRIRKVAKEGALEGDGGGLDRADAGGPVAVSLGSRRW